MFVRWDLSRAHCGANYALTLRQDPFNLSKSLRILGFSIWLVETGLFPALCEPELMFPLILSGSSFSSLIVSLHMHWASLRALVSSLHSFCVALSLALYPVTSSCCGVPRRPALSPHSGADLGSPSPGRKLGWQRAHCTCFYLQKHCALLPGVRCLSNCCFICFTHDLVASGERVAPIYSVLTRSRRPWGVIAAGSTWHQIAALDMPKLTVWPEFHLAYFYCCVMSDF